MTKTLIRVKRRRNEEPVNAMMMVVCKRQKMNETSMFHLVSSEASNSKNENLKRDLKNALLKRKTQEEEGKTGGDKPSCSKQPKPAIPWQSLEFADLNDDEVDNQLKWKSIQKSMNKKECDEDNKSEITLNGQKLTREVVEKDGDYVYDIYCGGNDISKLDISQLLYVRPVDEVELVYEKEHDEKEDDYNDYDDDSNDEGNWRNDYPDDESSSDDENGVDYERSCYGYTEAYDLHDLDALNSTFRSAANIADSSDGLSDNDY